MQSRIGSGKIIVVYGARQVGKTTLLKSIFPEAGDCTWFNGDDADVRTLFSGSMSSTRLKNLFYGKKALVLDEAQRIKNVGLILKMMVDNLEDIQVVASGSSSFELSDAIKEPLTGRTWSYQLFPLSFEELSQQHGALQESRLIPERMLHGSYPDVVKNPADSREILKNLSEAYLYKDLLMLNGLKKPDKLSDLLQALARQVGQQVSYNEVAQTIKLDKGTVEKYIDLLEKVFVLFRVSAFSRNLGNEIKATRKIYFYDNGILNVLLGRFTPVELRPDVGPLWENYLMSERRKLLDNNGRWAQGYFWRNTDQREIDYVEEEDGKLSAFEFKWGQDVEARFPKAFREAYPESTFQTVNSGNADIFLLSQK
jgi:predicted AAA+ superfamily ATPase